MKNEESKQITVQQPTELTPMAMISNAIASGMSPEALEKLMDLQERFEETCSRKAFNAAMAEFQSLCPIIKKGRKGNRGSYAGYDDVMKAVKPIMDTCGLSIIWAETQIDNGDLKISGVLLHKDGFSMKIKGESKIDPKMSANDSQKVGSAMSYAKRYTICAVLNIAVSEEDDDGYTGGLETIDEAKIKEIKRLLELTGSDEAKVLEYIDAPSIELMPITKYSRVLKVLNQKVKS